MARRESPSALLVISAIDLLLASLVCGVVLFISLVGKEGHTSEDQTGKSPEAPIPVSLLTRVDTWPVGVERRDIDIVNAERVGEPEEASPESVPYSGFNLPAGEVVRVETRWFRRAIPVYAPNRYQWVSYTVKPGKKEISIEGIPYAAYAAIHLGKSGSYYVWMRCSQPGWKLQLSLEPLRVLTDTCTSRLDQANRRPTAKPPKALFVVSDIAPPSDDWRTISILTPSTGIVSKPNKEGLGIPLDVSTAIFTY